MKKQPMRATGLVVAGVAAGAILGGTLSAQAADESGDGPPGRAPHVRVHLDGPGGPLGGDLADELGVSQEKLREAFRSIGDELRPAKRPDGPPSKADLKAMEGKLAAALAKELGLSEAKVKAALSAVHEEHRAERREALSKRLDRAVKAGKLTSDDKASVLKAFDAGVLGGPVARAVNR